MIKKDSELITIAEITERINSIERQREKRCDTDCRSHSVLAFEAKCKAIAKLTARHDALWVRRAQLIRASK
jgi:hypothetical protein